jgi:hypothetical protein
VPEDVERLLGGAGTSKLSPERLSATATMSWFVSRLQSREISIAVR